MNKSRLTEEIEYTLQHNNWSSTNERFKLRVFRFLHELSLKQDQLEADFAKLEVKQRVGF